MPFSSGSRSSRESCPAWNYLNCPSQTPSRRLHLVYQFVTYYLHFHHLPPYLQHHPLQHHRKNDKREVS